MNHERLPEELEGVAEMLRSNRAQADPLELDQIKRRAMARTSNPNRRFGFVKARLATFLTILGLVCGAGGAIAIAGNGNGNQGKGKGNGGAANGQYKPGWGCGDKNHTHTGPPGNPNANSPCK